jgi:hypothetical protein
MDRIHGGICVKKYAKTYTVRHGRDYKYSRDIPVDLQPVLGRKTWTRYLGTSLDVTQREALRLRVEHNDLIELLRSMTPVERSMFEPPPAKLMLSATIAGEEAKKMVQ